MCYSAMVTHQYRAYVKATGAQIDLAQFTDIFTNVARGERIVVPRVVEHWFAEPMTDAERHIHELIRQHRAAQATLWQQDLFAQKRRLADAERKLAQKVTKAASESKRIATARISLLLNRLALLNDPEPRPQDGRIFPMHYAPIVINDGGRNVIRLARYHCRLPDKRASVDGQFPGLYNARRDNLGRYWRGAFGSTHALMLADSFYENVERDGRNAVLHFVPRPAGAMLVACLHSTWKDPADGRELLSFAAITDEPPPEVAAAGHDRMIVNIRPENVDAWLTPQQRDDASLLAILDDRQTPYYEHEVMAA